MSIPESLPEAAASQATGFRPERGSTPGIGVGADLLASAAARRRLVARALGVPESRVAAVELRSDRERFGRLTAFLEAELAEVADLRGGERRRLVAKVYDSSREADRGAYTHRVCRALRAAGLAPPAAATVPEVHAYLPRERLLIMEHAPGRSWLERLVAAAGPDEADPPCRRAAGWLLALHRLPIDDHRALRRVLAARPAGAAVAVHCRELADHLPGLALRLAPWPQRLGPPLIATEGETPLPSHGDFHPGNLLLSPDRATAVDLDGAALREPAFDVGSGVAQLLAMSDLQEWPRGTAAGARAATAFWDAYRRGVPRPDRRRLGEQVTIHALATLLGVLHYSFEMATRRRDLGERWLPALEAWWEARGDGPAAGIARFAEALA